MPVDPLVTRRMIESLSTHLEDHLASWKSSLVDARREVERSLTGVVHHGVRPLTIAEWRLLLESEGFEVKATETTSMSLLEPGRLIRDEGVMGALRFALNVLKDGEARRRVFEMRRSFRRNRKILGAVALLATRQ